MTTATTVTKNNVTVDQYLLAKRIKALASIRNTFSSFIAAYKPEPKYIFGKHIKRIIAEMQKTTELFEKGICRYLIINVPFRHGKSVICSQRYPVWHLLRNPDTEIILGCYNHTLACDHSYVARNLFDDVGPRFDLSTQYDRAGIENWKIANHRGGMFATGLGGTITGRGAHIMLLDDPIKGREEAESQTIREKIWEGFQSDLMTRLAPVHAVIIIGNRWHEDDLVGRIIERNNPDSNEYNPDFPKFEIIKFPAYDEEKDEFLFTEKYPPVWYKTMRAAMSNYAWDAEAQQEPKPRAGNLLKTSEINFISQDELPKDIVFSRGWDLASSEKERTSSNPDYTVGTKVGFKDNKLYIANVKRVRYEAPARDKLIKNTAIEDGRDVIVKIESVAGYKDTYTHTRSQLSGYAVVRPYLPGTKDKVVRATYLEAIFEAGNVYLVKGDWNKPWINEIKSFPSGVHDDQVDSLVIGSSDDVKNASFRSFST